MQCNQQFDLVFLDPPYQKGMLEIALSLLVERKLLSPDCLLIWECDASEQIAVPKQIKIIKERTFGRICVRIGALL